MSNPSTPPLAPNQANAHPSRQTRTQVGKHAPKAQESTHQSPRANKTKPKTPAAKAHATPNPTAQNAQKNPTRESNPHSARATIPQPTAPQSHARASQSQKARFHPPHSKQKHPTPRAHRSRQAWQKHRCAWRAQVPPPH